MANATTHNDNPDTWLRFPPLPTAPPGETLISFKDFKPSGFPIASHDAEPDQVKLDGTGRPTVTLRVKHSLTSEEQSKSKRRKKKRTIVTETGGTRTLMWYEQWAEDEISKTCHVNPNLLRADRLRHASEEFKSSRMWPDIGAGVQNLWDAWRLYIGLISNVQPPPSKKKLAQSAAEQVDLDDDDDDEAMGDLRGAGRDAAAADSTEAGDLLEEQPVADEEEMWNAAKDEVLAIDEKKREAKDAKMDFFFDDPEMAVKIFFSAHYRDKGLIWDKVRCRDGPYIIQFFLEFLVRNRVLPESEKVLRKAIAVVETAKRELPLTFVVGEALPDKVSRSFERLFGSFINNMYWDGMEDKWRDSAGTKVEQPPAPTEETPTEEKVGGDASNFKEFLESSGEKDVQIVDINQAEVNPPSSGWGDASSSAWDNQGGGWGDPQTSDTHDGEGAWENSGDWGTTETGWIIDEPSLMEWLGPTLLPLTHTTGIMERSTRQITKVVPLPQLTQQPTKKKGKGKSKVVEELVEEELEKRLAYMVVAPWRKVGDHQSSDAVAPYILPDSRGLVACDKEESQGGQESSDSSIHNPAKDEIIVLITPQTAEKLHVGMGLQGVWVQIARRDPNAEDEVVEGDSKKKKGAPGVNGEATKWWYLEQLMCAIPSYHADRPSTS